MAGSVGNITTDIIKRGLVFNMDAANRASTIPSTSTDKTFNTVDTSISGSFVNDTIFDASTITPSYAFDGTEDYITIKGFNDITVTTTSVWFNFQLSGNKIVMEKGSNGKMMFQPLDSNRVWYANRKLYTNYSGFPGSIMNGTWNNWVSIEDTDYVYLYVNGVLKNSQANTTLSTNSGDITIMARTGGDHSQLGNIGPVQIYNRALSASEVLHNYNALKGRFV